MNPLLVVLYIVLGAFLGQVIRKLYAASKARSAAAEQAVENAFKYAHDRVDSLHIRLESEVKHLYEHFNERVKSAEKTIGIHTTMLDDHAAKLFPSDKSTMNPAGKTH